MFHKAFSPSNQITISADAIAENYHYFQSTYPQAVFAPVIKSNAYGHGLSEVGPIVDRLHAPYLCVNDMLEAETLRSLRIKTPILILGYTDPKSYQTLKKIPHTLTITDISQLEVLNTYQPGIKVHIKIDTGMNRLGVKLSQIPAFIDVAKNMEAVDFEGIFTHLASADEKEGNAQTKQQIDRFKEALRMFRHYGFLFKWRHVGHTLEGKHFIGPLGFTSSVQPLAHGLTNQCVAALASLLGYLVELLTGFVVKVDVEVHDCGLLITVAYVIRNRREMEGGP